MNMGLIVGPVIGILALAGVYWAYKKDYIKIPRKTSKTTPLEDLEEGVASDDVPIKTSDSILARPSNTIVPVNNAVIAEISTAPAAEKSNEKLLDDGIFKDSFISDDSSDDDVHDVGNKADGVRLGSYTDEKSKAIAIRENAMDKVHDRDDYLKKRRMSAHNRLDKRRGLTKTEASSADEQDYTAPIDGSSSGDVPIKTSTGLFSPLSKLNAIAPVGNSEESESDFKQIPIPIVPVLVEEHDSDDSESSGDEEKPIPLQIAALSEDEDKSHEEQPSSIIAPVKPSMKLKSSDEKEEVREKAAYVRQRAYSRANALRNDLNLKKMTSGLKLQERLKHKNHHPNHGSSLGGGGKKKVGDKSIENKKEEMKSRQHVNSDGLETDSIRSERDDKQNEDAFIEDDDDDVNTSENINIIDEDNKKAVDASDDRDKEDEDVKIDDDGYDSFESHIEVDDGIYNGSFFSDDDGGDNDDDDDQYHIDLSD